jgi:phosphoribosyl 1,2-cyclic phosphodiesterase
VQGTVRGRVRVFVLGSGSSGNAVLVEAAGARLLVDAGFGPRAAAQRLAQLGVDLFPRSVDGILVTHQHGDHIGHLEPLARATRAPIFLHRGIGAARVRHRFQVVDYDPGARLRVGPLDVETALVPHDAPQVAVRVSAPCDDAKGALPGLAFGIATDVGVVTDALVRLLRDCDAALVEANHCPVMLHDGPYPERLKKRVAGPYGHLANEQTADLAARVVTGRASRLAHMYLGHLSRANNTPERALAVVRRRVPDLGVTVVPHGAPQLLSVPRARRASQLALPFA